MTQYPAWTAGTKITSAALAAMTFITAIKPNTQAVTNNASYTSDNDLILPLAAGATYMWEGFLMYDTLAAAGINMRFSYSGTFSNGMYTNGAINGSSSTTTDTASYRAGSPTYGTGQALAGGNGAGAYLAARPGGVITTTTAGNLFFEWSQSVANATATHVVQGSWIRAIRQG